MADHFNAPRHRRRRDLGRQPASRARGRAARPRRRRVRVVFSVDLFNEGVDVPDVDTILMLRPTESPTLFLQQLGRGLRKTRGKAFCTVLDFVGTHRKEFRFDRRFRALLGGTRRDVERAVQQQFPFLPAGCHMELDAMAAEIVLRSLREAIPSRWPAKVEELRSLRRDHPDIVLADFLDESGLDLDDVYDGTKSWSDLRQDAGAPVLAAGSRRADAATSRRSPAARRRRRATRRLPATARATEHRRPWRRSRSASAGCCACSSRRSPTRRSPERPRCRRPSTSSGRTRRCAASCASCSACSTTASTTSTRRCAPIPMCRCRSTPATRVSRSSPPSASATAAKIPAWQSGVYEAKAANADLFAFTLDKSSGSFSPTTRYRDYAISRTLIHWESQSVTRADSETGLRYRNHERDGRTILLFARLRDRRPRLLVPRAGHLPRPRRRAADGDHLGARTTRCPATCTSRSPPPSRSDVPCRSADRHGTHVVIAGEIDQHVEVLDVDHVDRVLHRSIEMTLRRIEQHLTDAVRTRSIRRIGIESSFHWPTASRRAAPGSTAATA